MIWDAIDFVLRETALQLRRERLIAIATISTVAMLLLLLGAIALFFTNVRLWTDRVAQELEISAYFDREFDREAALQTRDEVADWPEVGAAVFVPKEEGWEWLKGRLAISGELQGMDNPLPDKVRVRVTNPEQISMIGTRLQGLEGMSEVIPNPDAAAQEGSFARTVVKVHRAVTWAGVLGTLLLAATSIFIVHNTIRLALHSRWREIYVMQLVGATRSWIAAPFMLEGAVHGALGAAVACCVLIPAHMYLRTLSADVAPFFFLAPNTILLPFAFYLILAGGLLGLTGSAVSVRRFLRGRPEWHG